MSKQSPHIEYLLSLSAQVKSEAELGFPQLNVTQLNWKPNATAWSIAQCLDHLLITNELYLQQVKTQIPIARSKKILPFTPYKKGWLAAKFIKQMSPEGKAAKTFKVFKPDTSTIDAGIVARFLQQHDMTTRLVKHAAEVDMNKVKVVSPASRFVKFRLGDAMELVLVHDLRHLAQARRVMTSSGFPL